MNEIGKSLLQLNIASILRNVYGIIRAKTTTIFLGVTGVGVLGQIFSVYNVQSKLVTFGVEAFLINRLGKISDQQHENIYHTTILYSGLIISLVNILLLFLCLLFLDELTYLIFGEEKYVYILLFLILLGPLFALSSLFEIITQARSKFSQLSKGRNIGSIAGILSFVPLIYAFNELGIVLSLYVFTISGGVYFFIANKNLLISISKIPKGYFKEFYHNFIKIGLTDITRKSLVFGSFLLFRIILVQFIGLEENGKFQAVWSISYYPDIFIGAFITYYFPTISKIRDLNVLRSEISRNYLFLLYIIFPIIVFLMVAPDLFLLLFYDKTFILLQNDLKLLVYLKYFQSIYNFFMITLLGQTFLRLFLFSEIIRNIGLLFFAYFLIPIYSFKGAVFSIVCMEFISINLIIFFTYKKNDLRISKDAVILTAKLLALLTILLIPTQSNIILRLVILILFAVAAYLIVDFNVYKKILESIFQRRHYLP